MVSVEGVAVPPGHNSDDSNPQTIVDKLNAFANSVTSRVGMLLCAPVTIYSANGLLS